MHSTVYATDMREWLPAFPFSPIPILFTKFVIVPSHSRSHQCKQH